MCFILLALEDQNFSSALGPGCQSAFGIRSDESSFKIFWIRLVQLMTCVSMAWARFLSYVLYLCMKLQIEAEGQFFIIDQHAKA